MPSVDDIMRSYVHLCIQDWKQVPGQLRRTLARCLPAGVIAENVHEAVESISRTYDHDDHSRLRFIPMPTERSKTGSFFFLPILHVSPSGDRVRSFELLLIRSSKHCVAFRFEGPSRGRHGYSHIQLCRTLHRKNVQVQCLPQWIHQSYPAFPSPGRDSLGIFLSMATAVHGLHDGGLLKVFRDVFQNRASLSRQYARSLETLLGVSCSIKP